MKLSQYGYDYYAFEKNAELVKNMFIVRAGHIINGGQLAEGLFGFFHFPHGQISLAYAEIGAHVFLIELQRVAEFKFRGIKFIIGQMAFAPGGDLVGL